VRRRECAGGSVVWIFIASTESDITSDIAQLRQTFERKPTRIMSHTTVCCGGVEMQRTDKVLMFCQSLKVSEPSNFRDIFIDTSPEVMLSPEAQGQQSFFT